MGRIRRICETLGEDSQGFMRDFGRGFTRIRGLWERIRKDSWTLGEDLQGFVRLWEREDL